MIIQIKNWKEFQHYKDRKPPWIKLHKGLLDDYEYHKLPVASKAIAPFIWLLASEYDDGKICISDEEISFRLRMPIGEIKKALESLVSSCFLSMSQDDSDPLAECKQDARLEEKRREEKNRDILTLGEFENVKLTKEEHEKLKQRLNGHCDVLVERLSGYLKQSGKKYKCHYAALLNWYSKDESLKKKTTGTDASVY